MHNIKDSGAQDRAETKAAKQQERSLAGVSAWADHNAKQELVEDNLARQRAMRLDRDRAALAIAKDIVKPKLKVRRQAA